MTQQHLVGRPACGIANSLTLLLLLLGVSTAQAERYFKDVNLTGSPVPSEHISGFRGTAYELGVPMSEGTDQHAVYGLTSEERRDHPCYVSLKTENINDSSGKLDLKKALCGGQERSKEIVAAYADSNYGQRSFVTGVRVCMNKDQDRVKGLQIRGKTLSDSGLLRQLERKAGDQTFGNISHLYPEEPKDDRPNCSDWKCWAECPAMNQIATAVELHFEAGKEPRSLVGVGLHCRTVQEPAPITGTPF